MRYLSSTWIMPAFTDSVMYFHEYEPSGASFLAWSAMSMSASFSKATTTPELL